MQLIYPTIEYKDEAIGFIQEFYDHKSMINGSGSLDRYLIQHSYEAWLDKIRADMDIANISDTRVPALTYFYVREEDKRIIGMINLRLSLNDFLRREGGHIGYCVRPTERGKGFATDMLRSALRVYDTLGIGEIIITCDKSNPASAAVIQKCNGVLTDEFYSETFDEVIQRYVISR